MKKVNFLRYTGKKNKGSKKPDFVFFLFEGEKVEVDGNSLMPAKKYNSLVIVGPRRYLLVNLGKKENFKLFAFRDILFDTFNYLTASAILKPYFRFCGEIVNFTDKDTFVSISLEAFYFHDYSFKPYKRNNSRKKGKSFNLTFLFDDLNNADLKRWEGLVRKYSVLSKSVFLARDLINTPANNMLPKDFVDIALKKAKKIPKVKAKVMDVKALKRGGFGGLLAVSRGSESNPYFLIMEYFGGGDKKKIALVGKGVCYDSGGLSLKPSSGMSTMKYDMSGAAVSLGILIASAELELNVNLVALIPLCENLPDGKAYRPGDVVKTLSGINVEVLNTDAEGRIILADALYYASNYKPEFIVDFATLTGAVKVCFGNKCAAVLGNDDSFVRSLINAGNNSYERLWQLPLWDEYGDDIKSDIADIKNVSYKGAGTITAAKFLSNFISDYDNVKWAHIDIAAVAWSDEQKGSFPKGATAFGIKLMMEWFLIN